MAVSDLGQGKKLLVIGTTSEVGFLDSVGICDAFSVTYHVPVLKTEDAEKVKLFLNAILDAVWVYYECINVYAVLVKKFLTYGLFPGSVTLGAEAA